nr:condensin complex subunit 2 [Drosophila takahashii]
MSPMLTPQKSIESNDTIRNCMEIYKGNKLSKENAWKVPLIDTLSNLMENHHKRMSNFKMAGSSLEASSKVYGLRVDSIYLDAMRISAGLSARTLTDKQLNAAEDDDGPQAEQAAGEGQDPAQQTQKEAAPKPKRQKKPMSTVTKNKDTLNARLDTAPLQDPVFGKLNSTVGSINASNRLMHNILPSLDSELRLRTTYKFWDSEEATEEVQDHTTLTADMEQWPAESLISTAFMRKLLPHAERSNLRPLHTGYIITSDPNPAEPLQDEDPHDEGLDDADEICLNDISMAFDINAECEPMPDLDGPPPVLLELDANEVEEFTPEEQGMLINCRRPTEFIEDLRPVDGNSKLEYSYRPMEQISQFWAGPSHWKFKRTGPQITFSQPGCSQRPKNRRPLKPNPVAKTISYGNVTEALFQEKDSTTRRRQVNFQRKWDPRKLILPTKYNLDPDIFFKYVSAPGIKISKCAGEPDSDENGNLAIEMDGEIDYDAYADPANVSIFEAMDSEGLADVMDVEVDNISLNVSTISEIGTEFDGAPLQFPKVVIPFAKKAKVIDMKNLKKSCDTLIQKQLLNDVSEEAIPSHPNKQNEQYSKGVASFQELYKELPNHLTPKMAESVSPSVALLAVLQLANDSKLRLIQEEGLEGFQIRQIKD